MPEVELLVVEVEVELMVVVLEMVLEVVLVIIAEVGVCFEF